MSLFGSGANRICAVAAAATAKDMARQVRSVLRETTCLELRLDWLRNDGERSRLLAWLKKTNFDATTFIATCRRRIAGGKFSGSEKRELFWLMRAREAGCKWCDLEVETLQGLPRGSLRNHGLPRKILLSAHDFERTPKPASIIGEAARSGADAAKIAAHSQTIADSVLLLRTARRLKNLVAVPMGEVGFPARILALREGSLLAYAPIVEATAPGQISLQDMKYLYRVHQLTRQSAVYGVIGNPIGHSLSPRLHNAAFAAKKIDAVYLPFLVRGLPDFLQAIPDLGIRGFSVTLPHKTAIMKHLKECEPLAAEIGAVNTVTVRKNGSLYGCNTDYVGVLQALAQKLRIRGSCVLILGAGGSARAAAFALAHAGANVSICARRENAGAALARAVGGEALPRRALRSQRFDAILNSTPVGMHPRADVTPLTAGELHCGVVMDFIYRPRSTRLLKIASKKGITVISGVEMFVAQGVAQWELWTGKRAPAVVMRNAVLRALRAEESQQGEKRRL